MSKVILESILSPENVQAAWKRLRRDRAPWAPGVSREELERTLPFHLTQLVEDLRSGRFRPEALRQYTAQKGDGEYRIISAQYLRDKLAQRLVHQCLDQEFDSLLHPDSFGFRRGRGVPHAVARLRERIATGMFWLVDADIRSFFDRVPHSGLNRVLKRRIGDRRVRRLLQQWMAIGAHRDSLLEQRRGLAQGMILSPLLCNLYLDRFDDQMVRANIPFVRFADDFVLLAGDREAAQRAHDHAARTLARMGLELHPGKTRVCRASPAVAFLGKPVVRRRSRLHRRLVREGAS